MPPFEKHIFICVNERPADHPRGCCKAKGSEKIRDLFKEALAKRGLKNKVRANAAGCLDWCERGPTVVVYPDGIWYHVETEADVQDIVEQHIIQGKPVQRLAISRVTP